MPDDYEGFTAEQIPWDAISMERFQKIIALRGVAWKAAFPEARFGLEYDEEGAKKRFEGGIALQLCLFGKGFAETLKPVLLAPKLPAAYFDRWPLTVLVEDIRHGLQLDDARVTDALWTGLNQSLVGGTLALARSGKYLQLKLLTKLPNGNGGFHEFAAEIPFEGLWIEFLREVKK